MDLGENLDEDKALSVKRDKENKQSNQWRKKQGIVLRKTTS